MKLIAYSILLLVILEESYCKTTSSFNKTNQPSTNRGYDYSLSNSRVITVKQGDKLYHFEPFYNNTSSGLKKHNNSRSVHDQFTSPEATDDRQSNSSKNDVINGTTSIGTANYRSNSSEKRVSLGDVIWDNKWAGKVELVTKSRTVTETQTEASVTTEKASYKTTSPYGSQNTPIYTAPTHPLYYPQAPSYGQMDGPEGGLKCGVSSGPMYVPPTGRTYRPTGPIYGLPTSPVYGYAPQNSQMYEPPLGSMYEPPTGSTYGPTGPIYGLPTRSVYGYAPQNSQMYEPPMGPMYEPPTGRTYGPTGPIYGLPTRSVYGYAPQNSQMYEPPMGPMYEPPTGRMYGSTGPIYGLPTRYMYGYAPQNGQMYGPPNGQMYFPQNYQTNGYPTGSLNGSIPNY